jgi:hypothetical protein
MKKLLLATSLLFPYAALAQPYQYTLPVPIPSQRDYYYDNGTGTFTSVSQGIAQAIAGSGQSALPFYNATQAGLSAGSSNNSTAFSNFLTNTIAPNGGGTLFLPCGTFKFANMPSITVASFYIIGTYGCTVLETTTSTDLVSFSGTYTWGGLANLRLTSSLGTSSTVAGCLIDLENGVSNIIVENVIVSNGYNGVCKNNPKTTYFDTVNVSNMANDCWLTTNETIGFLTGVTAIYCANAAHEIQGSSGWRMTNSTGQASNYNMLINGLTNNVFTGVTVNSNFDDGTTNGLRIDTSASGTNNVYQLQFVGDGFSYSSGVDILATGPSGTCYDLEFTGVNANKAVAQGYLINECVGVEIHGGEVNGNSSTGTAVPAIQIGAATDVVIDGTAIKQYANVTGHQNGINFTSSFSTTAVARVTAPLVTGNQGYDLFVNSASPSITLLGPMGNIQTGSYLPCESGTATIANGTSSVAVTFAVQGNASDPLPIAPTKFSLTGSNPSYALGVSSVTNTGMTINTSSNVSGNVTVYWTADINNQSSCY